MLARTVSADRKLSSNSTTDPQTLSRDSTRIDRLAAAVFAARAASFTAALCPSQRTIITHSLVSMPSAAAAAGDTISAAAGTSFLPAARSAAKAVSSPTSCDL
jgi:hypothetical protein